MESRRGEKPDGSMTEGKGVRGTTSTEGTHVEGLSEQLRGTAKEGVYS